jgi:hypothetical protein
MPRTVNSPLADNITAFDPISSTNPTPKNQFQRNFRVVHALDYIPDSIFLSYTVQDAFAGGIPGTVITSRHSSPSFNITTPSKVIPPFGSVFLNDTDGTSQQTGVTLDSFAKDISDPHNYYFGQINACA